MEYDTILTHVINGIKAGVPIYKTLKKFKYDRGTFYRKTDMETERYFNELKCLKTTDRTKRKCSRHDPYADFTVLD